MLGASYRKSAQAVGLYPLRNTDDTATHPDEPFGDAEIGRESEESPNIDTFSIPGRKKKGAPEKRKEGHENLPRRPFQPSA